MNILPYQVRFHNKKEFFYRDFDFKNEYLVKISRKISRKISKTFNTYCWICKGSIIRSNKNPDPKLPVKADPDPDPDQ